MTGSRHRLATGEGGAAGGASPAAGWQRRWRSAADTTSANELGSATRSRPVRRGRTGPGVSAALAQISRALGLISRALGASSPAGGDGDGAAGEVRDLHRHEAPYGYDR